SPIYVKGAGLFGLWQARHAIRESGRAILVEGNFDVVSLHARGVKSAVAPLGTAFTTDQAKLLRRYSVDVTLLFDGDAAGRKASHAAEQPAQDAELDVKVAILPASADPDDFVRAKGLDALRMVLASSRGLLEYLIDALLDESFNAADVREQATRMDRVAALIGRQKDQVVRGMLKVYADQAAGRLDLVRSYPNAFGALYGKIKQKARIAGVYVGPKPWEARVRSRSPGEEERKAIVGALLEYPGLIGDPALERELELLEGESARIVAGLVKSTRMTARGEKEVDRAEFLAQMPPAIQAFASARFAAPTHETPEEARNTLIANAKKLRETNVALETRVAVREQHKIVGDWEAEVEVAKHMDALVRERQGLTRR
ncbi:MAG: toprim domain-containing protein, partial [Polyangiaceae bacterium]